jgi:hypothetical protein
MADIIGTSRAAAQPVERLPWLQRIYLLLGRSLQRTHRGWRIDEQAWSGYMLRDIGLDEGRRSPGQGPRDLPIDWPLR